MQTVSVQEQIEQLYRVIADKEAEIRALKEQVTQEAASSKAFETKNNYLGARIEQMIVELKVKQRQVDELQAGIEVKEKEAKGLEQAAKDAKFESRDVKWRLDKVQEELSKLKIAQQMQRKLFAAQNNLAQPAP